LGDAKLGEIEKEDEDGEITYTVNLTNKDGKEHYFTVAGDGTLSSVEVDLEETPPEVQKTIKAQAGQGSIDDIEKTFEDNEISYEVEMTRKDGAERSFSVAPDGKLTSIQVSVEETPAVVRKTIEAHLGDGKLANIYRLIEGKEISYDAEVDHNGKTRDIIVAPNGKIESLQVFLSEIPAEAQKTIQEKVANGKLLRIDRAFELKHGVQPYEVEARKEGKPFNFSVGPKGRFLGMDK